MCDGIAHALGQYRHPSDDSPSQSSHFFQVWNVDKCMPLPTGHPVAMQSEHDSNIFCMVTITIKIFRQTCLQGRGTVTTSTRKLHANIYLAITDKLLFLRYYIITSTLNSSNKYSSIHYICKANIRRPKIR
jgi:hypothetical protein